jgi:hypothetical protein
MSGCYRTLADIGNVYVIRANGSVDSPTSDFWFGAQQGTALMRPGDTIVVPYDSDNVDNMTLWTNVTQILYQLAVAIAAISSL